ncbi:MAG: hypothetical protein ACI4TD_08110 [Phocaeicola sp.]
MLKEINRTKPIARKQHKCNFCGGVIEKGEMYDNTTFVFDSSAYTWKSHLHCLNIASYIDDYSDEGITEDDFATWINEYVYENHFDEEIDDINKEWQDKSIPELAKMINDELNAVKFK